MKTAGPTPLVGARQHRRRLTMAPSNEMVAQPQSLFQGQQQQQQPSVSNGKLRALVPEKDVNNTPATNKNNVYRYLTRVHWKNDKRGPEDTPEDAQKVVNGSLFKHVVGIIMERDFAALPTRVSSKAFTRRKIFITTPQQPQKRLKPQRTPLESDGPLGHDLKRSDNLLEMLPVIQEDDICAAPTFVHLWTADEAPWISLCEEPVIFPHVEQDVEDYDAHGAGDDTGAGAVQHEAQGADDGAEGADDGGAHDGTTAGSVQFHLEDDALKESHGADGAEANRAGLCSSDAEGQEQEPFEEEEESLGPERQPDWTLKDILEEEEKVRASKSKEQLEEEEVKRAGLYLTNNFLPLHKLRPADPGTMAKYNHQTSVQEYEDLQHDKLMARQAAEVARCGGKMKRYKPKSTNSNKKLFSLFQRAELSGTFCCLLYINKRFDDPTYRLALNVAHMSEEMFLFAMLKWWTETKNYDLRKFQAWIGDIAKFDVQDALIVIGPLWEKFKIWIKYGQLRGGLNDDAALSTIRKLLSLEPHFARVDNQLQRQAEIGDVRHAEQADMNAHQARVNASVQQEQQQNDGRLAALEQDQQDHRAEVAGQLATNQENTSASIDRVAELILFNERARERAAEQDRRAREEERLARERAAEQDRLAREEERREAAEERREEAEFRRDTNRGLRVLQENSRLMDRRVGRVEDDVSQLQQEGVRRDQDVSQLQQEGARRDQDVSQLQQEGALRDQQLLDHSQELAEIRTTIKKLQKKQSRLEQGNVTEPNNLVAQLGDDDFETKPVAKSVKSKKKAAPSAKKKKATSSPNKKKATSSPNKKKAAQSPNKKKAAVRFVEPSSPPNSKKKAATEDLPPATPMVTKGDPPVPLRRSTRKRKPLHV